MNKLVVLLPERFTIFISKKILFDSFNYLTDIINVSLLINALLKLQLVKSLSFVKMFNIIKSLEIFNYMNKNNDLLLGKKIKKDILL